MELTVESLLVEEDLFNAFKKKALNSYFANQYLLSLVFVVSLTCTLVYAAHQ